MEMPDCDFGEKNESFIDVVGHIGNSIIRVNGIVYHANGIVEALRRENEELKAKLDKAKWQPIETAPKDGSRILLAAPWIPLEEARLQTCYGHWYKIGKRWEYDGYSFGNPTSQPTKWMPLPDANAPEQHIEDVREEAQEEILDHDDPLSPARGILNGLVLSIIAWLAIVFICNLCALVYYLGVNAYWESFL